MAAATGRDGIMSTVESPTTGELGEHKSAVWPLLALLVLAGAALVAIQWRRPKPPDPYVGLMLPPIEAGGWLNTPQPLSVNDVRGKVVLVDFWATNCPSCVSEMPSLAALHEKFGDHGLVIVGLTPESEAELPAVKHLIEREKIDWPIGYGAGLAFEMMGIEGTPTYLLYDKTGRSIWGGHSLYGVEDAILTVLAKN